MALVGRLLRLGCLFLLGCGVRFVDPHPPELSRLSREYVQQPVDAPVIYGLILDLHLPDAAECSRVRARLEQTFRTALLPPGREGLELRLQELSPGCVQSPDRRLDVSAYEAQLAEAAQRFGAQRVRPLLLYFANLELPASPALRFDFSTLRGSQWRPLMWALAPADALQGLSFDQTAAWTYGADPALTAPLESPARAQLPLTYLPEVPAEGEPLFTPEELTWVREFKACNRPRDLVGVNFTLAPGAVRLDASRPPRVRLLAVQSPPQPRGQLQPLRVPLALEVCRAHCERLFDLGPDEDPLVWNATPRCLLKGTS